MHALHTQLCATLCITVCVAAKTSLHTYPLMWLVTHSNIIIPHTVNAQRAILLTENSFKLFITFFATVRVKNYFLLSYMFSHSKLVEVDLHACTAWLSQWSSLRKRISLDAPDLTRGLLSWRA